jgi:hypothetical protein
MNIHPSLGGSPGNLPNSLSSVIYFKITYSVNFTWNSILEMLGYFFFVKYTKDLNRMDVLLKYFFSVFLML